MNNAIPFVKMGKKLNVRATHRKEFDVYPAPKSVSGEYRYRIAQGGCEAKGFLYSWMISDSKDVGATKSCVVKHNLATGEIVGVSGEMELGHANDATYNPDENTILVSFCDGTTRMAVLDADTLQLKNVIELEGRFLCNIHYDSVTKTYVSVAYQCEDIYVYDKDFKILNHFNGKMSNRYGRDYVMQGVIHDGVYAYVLEWHGGKSWVETNTTIEEDAKSGLLVYDLKTGEFVQAIDLGIHVEIEYAVYWNSKFYFGCNNISWNGLEVYEVEITSENG